MKTSPVPLSYLEISLFLMLFVFCTSNAQINIYGSWEGTFMNDFKAIVNFTTDDEDRLKGNIKMFAGENMIQDDKLININLSGNKVSFDIPAKETTFEGNFNDQITELSGGFIFPDGSNHTIHLIKGKNDSDPYEKYKLLKDKFFSPEELQDDLTFLFLNLKKHHPQLNSHTPKDSLDILVENLKVRIDTPRTIEDFYLLATSLTDAIRCSHTGVRLPMNYQKMVNKFGNYFPLKLHFSNGKAFYISGSTEGGDSIKPGQEIFSINDITVDQIIAQTFLFIPAEGYNTTTKYNFLNKRFNEFFYWLSDSEEFIVRFYAEGTIQSMIVPASPFKDVPMEYQNTEAEVDYKFFDETDTGMLKVPSFGIRNMNRYFFHLDSIFKDLGTRNAQNLILDLRDNTGGHPIYAAQLFSYLTSKNFIYFKRNEEVEEFEPLYKVMNPSKLNYNGNLYVLINGGCLSTTGHLISLLKFNTDATFVGEEPGSTFLCNDFSNQFILPNTGIELNVPRTTFETAVKGFSLYEPFPIDFKVQSTIDDIINDKDVILEKTMLKINHR